MSERRDNYITINKNGITGVADGVVQWFIPSREPVPVAIVARRLSDAIESAKRAICNRAALRRALILAGVLFVLLMLGG
jgi:hypothetical protein